MTLNAQDNLKYKIDKFDFELNGKLNSLVEVAKLKSDLKVKLVNKDGIYSFDKAAKPVLLSSLEGKDAFYDISALNTICLSMVRALNDDGWISVFVGAAEGQIDESGKDIRENKSGTFKLTIWNGVITDLRTISQGYGFDNSKRVNNPRHAKMLESSPLQAAGKDGLLNSIPNRHTLNEYINWLDRHPGRSVTAAFSAGLERGDVTLDYIVTEFKPWLAYLQVGNTGTEGTGEWRTRLGYINNQLTKRDDILSFDASVSEFNKSQSYMLSYDLPIALGGKLRLKPYFSYSEYTSEDFATDLEFAGESVDFGIDLKYTVFQYNSLFVDLTLGLSHQSIELDDDILKTVAEEDLTYLTAGVSADFSDNKHSFHASLSIDTLLGDIDEDNVNTLGRLAVDESWEVLHYSLYYSFFLEPLLFGEDWYDPKSWKSSTLGHEFKFHLRGQDALGNRLIPQDEFSAGGLYTVRGYDEAVTNEDNAVVFTFEYALHLPALLKPSQSKRQIFGQDVKFRPRFVYDTADWDLALKVFYDMAVTENNKALTGEFDQTLSSAGIGIDFKYKRFINMRLDWGYVLEDMDSFDSVEPAAEKGDSRVHFSLTLIF